MIDDDDDIQEYVRPWVGLTEEEIYEIRFSQELDDCRVVHLLRKVEAKLKEKNA